MKFIIDLLMRTGSFETDTARASKIAKRRAKEIEKSFADAGRKIRNVFAGLAGGIGIASLMRTFARETINAQNEQAQLAAVVQSTGKAAGFSVEQLNKMADELARVSTFDGGDINRAQARLLSYTGIVGEQFPKAMQATIDMAARMGMSVEMSAETIGRALDIPSQGLTALTRQGFRFTEAQKAAVEQLEATGRVGEAQAIVLEALESSYGGAAQAARDTFGGAIAALQNELRDLMTGKDGSLDGARGAVEDLTKTLQSSETKAAFESLTNAFAKVLEWSVKATAGVLNFSKFVGESFARWVHGPDSVVERLAEKIQGLERDLVSVERTLARTPGGSPAFAATEAQAESLRKKIAGLRREQSDWERMASVPGAPTAPEATGGTSGLSEAETARLAAQRKAAEERARSAQAASRQADAYIESLKRQMQATQDLTVVEKTLEEIRAGSLSGAGSRRQQEALAIAAALDEHAAAADRAKEAEEELQALIREQELIFEEGRRVMESMRTPAEQLNVQIERLNFLLDKGAIDWETYARAMFDAQDGFDRAQEASDKAGKQLDDFAKNAAENIQRDLGDTLADAMNGNFKGIGDSFVQMLNRMVAEALAADIARKLFGGDSAGGVSGKGGLFGSALGAIGQWFGFGGAKASGGDVLADRAHLVGEQGPELFVPRTAGTIIPTGDLAAAAGGRSGVTQYNNFAFAAPTSPKTQTQVASRIAFEQRRAARLTR